MKNVMKILLLVGILLICGCSNKKQNQIHTIIEENNVMIGINYPTTGIKKLDQAITSYVDNTYLQFKKNYQNVTLQEKPELNIDYTMDEVDGYISITLRTFINSSSLAHPITELKTFVYNQKLLSLQDIIDKETLIDIVPFMQQQLLANYKDCLLLEEMQSQITPDFSHYPLFTITSKSLIIYFNPYYVTSGNCGIIHIEIPLDKLNIHISNSQFISKEVPNQTLLSRTIDPKQKVVALTFDDGPSKYTNQIIEYFHENDVVGTFFMLGNKVNNYQDTVKKVLAYGNEIGNHSYNHKLMSHLSIDDLHEQIDKTQDIIHSVTGFTPSLLRPSYGSVNQQIKNNTDLKIVLWTVDTLDWKIKNPEQLAKKALKDIKDGSIVLMHDTKPQTVKALKLIIPKLKEEGYIFVTVSELEEVKLLRHYDESTT